MESHEYKGDKIRLTEEEWKERLDPEAYYILREGGTENAFSSHLHDQDKKGVYICAACGLELFSSQDKFHSKSGWPSFTRPIIPENIQYEKDQQLFTTRIEVLCSRCDSHLGHVFEDGPQPTGLRFCINGLALDFKPEK